MRSLNLPTYIFRIINKDNKTLIFDRLRKKYVALTPEEWVRQNVVEFLIVDKGFPAERMGNEISLQRDGIKRRCDTVYYSISGEPLLIAEFKAPDVEISQSTFDQISRYITHLRTPYLLISNGLMHYCCHLDYTTMQMEYLTEIPGYDQITKEYS
jgi:hypothetical protein